MWEKLQKYIRGGQNQYFSTPPGRLCGHPPKSLQVHLSPQTRRSRRKGLAHVCYKLFKTSPASFHSFRSCGTPIRRPLRVSLVKSDSNTIWKGLPHGPVASHNSLQLEQVICTFFVFERHCRHPSWTAADGILGKLALDAPETRCGIYRNSATPQNWELLLDVDAIPG